jgi:hypothetical protein
MSSVRHEEGWYMRENGFCHYYSGKRYLCNTFEKDTDRPLSRAPISRNRCATCSGKWFLIKQSQKQKVRRKDVCLWMRFESSVDMAKFMTAVMKIKPEPIKINFRSIETWREN